MIVFRSKERKIKNGEKYSELGNILSLISWDGIPTTPVLKGTLLEVLGNNFSVINMSFLPCLHIICMYILLFTYFPFRFTNRL